MLEPILPVKVTIIDTMFKFDGTETCTLSVVRGLVMAYLHCGRGTRLWTRILIPFLLAVRIS